MVHNFQSWEFAADGLSFFLTAAQFEPENCMFGSQQKCNQNAEIIVILTLCQALHTYYCRIFVTCLQGGYHPNFTNEDTNAQVY